MGNIQVVFYALSMQDRPTFGVLSNQGLCHLCSVATTTENFSETKFRKKKSKFLVYGKTHYHRIFIYGKMLIIEFSYNFLYVWNCMKLYDKKFLIYGNYMIRSFGQPGQRVVARLYDTGKTIKMVPFLPYTRTILTRCTTWRSKQVIKITL